MHQRICVLEKHRLGWATLSLTRWHAALLILSIAVVLPIVSVIWLAFNPSDNIWPHLFDTVLPHYISTTVLLLIGVVFIASMIGVSTAWLVTVCEFPGRRYFEVLLLLPFAIPAYVIAYLYTDLLEYAGPLQSALRDFFGWESSQDYYFPAVRSLGGAIVMLSLVLYPYIYLMARASFLEQSQTLSEAARALGASPWRSFFKVSMPIARPAIVVGISLVAMETLNDFGTVDFFAVKSLSAGIYDAWLNMGNLGAAAQIATLMLIFVSFTVMLERRSRSTAAYFTNTEAFKSAKRYVLKGALKRTAVVVCALPVLLGFVIPMIQLMAMAISQLDQFMDARFIGQIMNTLMLSGGAAFIALSIAIIIAYANRLKRNKVLITLSGMTKLGYALPGAVLAIGVIIPFAAFDNAIDAWMRTNFDLSTGLILSGTPFALLFAYTVRFLAVSSGSVESSLIKVTPHMDRAAASLGASRLRTLKEIHLPMIKGGALTAVLVVFVDCMKELPATLILRPFNFDTLATAAYQYASDERLSMAAPAALLIVLAGILPVILLSRSISQSRQTS